MKGAVPVRVPVSVWLLPAHTGVVVALKAAVGRGFTVMVVLAAGRAVAVQLLLLSAVMVYVVVALSAPVGMANVLLLLLMESVVFVVPPSVEYVPVKFDPPDKVPVSVVPEPLHTAVVGAVKAAVGRGFTVTVTLGSDPALTEHPP